MPLLVEVNRQMSFNQITSKPETAKENREVKKLELINLVRELADKKQMNDGNSIKLQAEQNKFLNIENKIAGNMSGNM